MKEIINYKDDAILPEATMGDIESLSIRQSLNLFTDLVAVIIKNSVDIAEENAITEGGFDAIIRALIEPSFDESDLLFNGQYVKRKFNQSLAKIITEWGSREIH